MYFIPIVTIAGILAWMSRPGKDLSQTGKNAILLLSIPYLILAAVSVIVQLLKNSTGDTDLYDISNILFIAGAAIIIIAVILLAFSQSNIKLKSSGRYRSLSAYR
jgi:hypothetical protein